MVEAVADVVGNPDWDTLSDRQRVDTLLSHIQTDYGRRTLAPSEAIIRLDDSGEADVPVQRLLTEISASNKDARGYKWLAILVAGAFTIGGSFAVWNGNLVTDGTMKEKLSPMDAQIDANRKDIGALKGGVGNIIIYQERDREIAAAEARVQVYKDERAFVLSEWEKAPKKTRAQKPSSITKELLDAQKALKDVREEPLIIEPVDLTKKEPIP